MALVGIVILWGVRDYEHRRAVNALQARSYQGADPIRASAYPDIVNPFNWYGVVETSSFFALAPVNAAVPEVDPEGNLEIRYKPEETAVTLAAKKSYLGRVYLDWARYPITDTDKLWPPQEGYIVHFQDLRFAQLPNLPFLRRDKNSRPLSAGVQLDKNLHVVAYIFGSAKSRIVAPEPGSPTNH
jgi:inner membrane protein